MKIPVVRLLLAFTAHIPTIAFGETTAKQCEALKPIQQLEKERERKVDLFLQAAAPLYGSGKLNVSVDTRTNWDTRLLEGDDLAQAFFGYQVCVMRATQMIDSTEYVALLSAIYGPKTSPSSSPTSGDTLAPKDTEEPPNLEVTIPPDSAQSTSAQANPNARCSIVPGQTLTLRSPMNLFSFDVGDFRVKLLQPNDVDELMEVAKQCGAYEAATTLSTFKADRKEFSWKATPAAYNRLFQHYEMIVRDFAQATQTNCIANVGKLGELPCDQAVRRFAPKAFE